MPVAYEGPPDELSGLVMFLEAQRWSLLNKIDGLTDEQATSQPTVSAFCMLTLIKHVAFVERRWFQLEVARRAEVPRDAAVFLHHRGEHRLPVVAGVGGGAGPALASRAEPPLPCLACSRRCRHEHTEPNTTLARRHCNDRIDRASPSPREHRTRRASQVHESARPLSEQTDREHQTRLGTIVPQPINAASQPRKPSPDATPVMRPPPARRGTGVGRRPPRDATAPRRRSAPTAARPLR